MRGKYEWQEVASRADGEETEQQRMIEGVVKR